MPYMNVSQLYKELDTAAKASSPNNQVDPSVVRPTALLSSDPKVLDDSFLLPESDNDGGIETDSEGYELTDEELKDYGRPGRRRASDKQSLLPERRNEEKSKNKGVWFESFSSEVSKVKKSLKGKRTKQSGDGKQESKETQKKSGSSK